LAGTKAVVVVHPLKGTGGNVEQGVSGDVCHVKIFQVFSRGIAATRLFGKLVRRLDKWYMDLDQVGIITYHDDCSSASNRCRVSRAYPA
jgi:hypothetical protein